MYIGKYVFKFHAAILLGACVRRPHHHRLARHDLDQAKSKIPALGYTVTYAVGNTLLTIWGMIIVMMMS